MSDDQDLEELRAATERTDRASATPGVDVEETDLADAIVAELEAIDAGDRQKTVSVWDGPLAAFVAVLEEGDDAEAVREELGAGVAQAFDLEDTPTDRATLLRLALRLGVREAAPEQYDAIREAVRRRASQDL